MNREAVVKYFAIEWLSIQGTYQLNQRSFSNLFLWPIPDKNEMTYYTEFHDFFFSSGLHMDTLWLANNASWCPPKNAYLLISETYGNVTLHSKSNFANVIKIKVSEKEDYS